MNEELLQPIDRRADALWRADGSPEGHELVYRLRAEQEIANASVAGEEDPLSGVEVDDEAASSTEHALRRSFEDAVPEPERLPSGGDENPISDRIRDEADVQPAPAIRPTLQGGGQVA